MAPRHHVSRTGRDHAVNDFRPISLLNTSPKIVAKLLANRLQGVALQVVHDNQYGFVKGKTIQDCLGWAFEYLHRCHHSKREIVILKVDFEKAFDLVEHEFVLAMLRAKGFPLKWVKWIEDLLSSATSSVLVNGTSGKEFKCKKEEYAKVTHFLHSYLQLQQTFFKWQLTRLTGRAILSLLSPKTALTHSQ